MVTSFLSILGMSSEFSIGHAFYLFKLIFFVVTSFVLLSEEKISKIKKKKSKNPKKNNDNPKIDKKEGQKCNNILRSTYRAPLGLCLRVLISAMFLIIFLLFTSLDTSGTWNIKRLATKTSTRDTYSALSGSKIFILDKNLSQDPIFVVTSFLSILSSSSEFSTGHAFH